MFAVLNILRGGQARQITAGVFYALSMIYGFVPPCWSLNGPTASKVLSNGTGETVFLFSLTKNKLFRMLNTERICSGVKYSTLSTTDDARQAFLEKFPLVQKLKISHRKYYYFAHAVCNGRKLFCHAYKSWEALIDRFEAEYNVKCLDMMPE